jgi:23S rRNA pseudouridine2457 synthase
MELNQMAQAHKYYIIYKPYNMVSQFVSPDAVRLLGELDFDFPEGTHAIGRLDSNSEGLLILTTNKKITKLLFESKRPHNRTYLVQIRDEITPEKLEQLRTGVDIEVKEGENYRAIPVDAQLACAPANFEEIYPHYRQVPHSWITLTLTEGKFHQVRKMVKALRHPCKRLIRISIENLLLGDMNPGEVREIEEADFFEKVFGTLVVS